MAEKIWCLLSGDQTAVIATSKDHFYVANPAYDENIEQFIVNPDYDPAIKPSIPNPDYDPEDPEAADRLIPNPDFDPNATPEIPNPAYIPKFIPDPNEVELDVTDPMVVAYCHPETLISDFEKARTAQHTLITNTFKSLVRALTKDYPSEERESWPRQDLEAKAMEADVNAATPHIDAIAAARGISRTILKDKIIENVAQFESASGTLIGIRQKLRDDLDALDENTNSIADIEAIVWP